MGGGGDGVRQCAVLWCSEGGKAGFVTQDARTTGKKKAVWRNEGFFFLSFFLSRSLIFLSSFWDLWVPNFVCVLRRICLCLCTCVPTVCVCVGCVCVRVSLGVMQMSPPVSRCFCTLAFRRGGLITEQRSVCVCVCVRAFDCDRCVVVAWQSLWLLKHEGTRKILQRDLLFRFSQIPDRNNEQKTTDKTSW